MREEGIDFPDPTFDIDGNPEFDNLEIENEDEFETAFENCEEILRNALPEQFDLDPEVEAALVDASLEFSQCMREEGIDFPDELSINDETFVLNGGGLREKLGFLDLYVGGLYLSANSSDANQIVMSGNSMAIRIVIASRLVSRERFIEALEEGFKNTTVGKYTPMQIESFKKYLSDPFEINDEIILVYNSEDESTYLYKNSEIRGEFSGLPFKQALFGIWLGDKPAQESLKKEMLGL